MKCICRFYGLKKEYNRVNRETIWQVMRMYDVGGKLLSGIKGMYVNSLVCVGVRVSIPELKVV